MRSLTRYLLILNAVVLAFVVGADMGTPVDDKDYQLPFRFTGKLNKLTIKIDRPQLTLEDIKKLEEAMKKAATKE
jgi:arylsulfatase